MAVKGRISNHIQKDPPKGEPISNRKNELPKVISAKQITFDGVAKSSIRIVNTEQERRNTKILISSYRELYSQEKKDINKTIKYLDELITKK